MTETEILEELWAERHAVAERLGDHQPLQMAAEYEKLAQAQLRIIEEALRRFPTSVRLWNLRGDLIQLGADDGQYSLADALASYRTALEHDPSNLDALESIGHFLDVMENEPAEAEPYFRKAIPLGAGDSAREGLAQVMEQLERSK